MLPLRLRRAADREDLTLASVGGAWTFDSTRVAAGELLERSARHAGELVVRMAAGESTRPARWSAWALPVGDGSGEPRMLMPIAGDQHGELRIGGLPPGSWHVCLAPSSGAHLRHTLRVDDLQVGEHRVAPRGALHEDSAHVRVRLRWADERAKASLPGSVAMFAHGRYLEPLPRTLQVGQSHVPASVRSLPRRFTPGPILAAHAGDGWYEAELPMGGPWELSVTYGDRMGHQQAFEAVAGETREVECVLPSIGELDLRLELPAGVAPQELDLAVTSRGRRALGRLHPDAPVWQFGELYTGELSVTLTTGVQPGGHTGVRKPIFEATLQHVPGERDVTLDLRERFPARLALHADPALARALVVAACDEERLDAFLAADEIGPFLLKEARVARLHAGGVTRLHGIPPGDVQPWFTNTSRSWVVRARSPRHLEPAGTGELEVQLELVRREVRIVDENGAPLGGQELRWSTSGRELPRARVELDADGRAELLLPRGPLRLTIEERPARDVEWRAGDGPLEVEIP